MAKRTKHTTIKKSRPRRSPPIVPDDIFTPLETKRQKFVRLSEARMTKAIASIELLGNLATYNYDWTPEDIEAMREALKEAVERTFRRYTRHRRGEGHQSFQLCH